MGSGVLVCHGVFLGSTAEGQFSGIAVFSATTPYRVPNVGDTFFEVRAREQFDDSGTRQSADKREARVNASPLPLHLLLPRAKLPLHLFASVDIGMAAAVVQRSMDVLPSPGPETCAHICFGQQINNSPMNVSLLRVDRNGHFGPARRRNTTTILTVSAFGAARTAFIVLS
jgi:hypothetical protein